MPDVLMGIAKAGLKQSPEPDLLVVLLPVRSIASFLFTDNFFKSGSVIYSEETFKKNRNIRAFVVNSGNANCGTGKEGIKHARQIAERTALKLKLKPEEVLVFSTGIIGKPLPIEKVLIAIDKACSSLEPLDLKKASQVITTTDSFPKFDFIEKRKVKTFGFAKGAGMIAPSMATMLAFVFTEAFVEFEKLRVIHKKINEKTFNSITVDGCKSTNDSFALICIGNKKAPLSSVEKDILQIAGSLAKKIVEDGEGASRVIKITVKGADSSKKAKEIAKAVANSLLVKTAVYGKDPNWGRIAAAAGSTTFPIDPFKLEIRIGEYTLYEGKPLPFSEESVRRYLQEEKEVEIILDLKEGKNDWTYYSSDLGYEYVKINAEYST